jgi:DNA-binding transcriptional LysR family regulator
MDTELARTFLTVVAAGNFISAADRLHVSQSTVSTRIHSLEDQLGCTLFVRNKAGTTLTSAGRQFQRHAATLVRTIEQARHDIGIPEGFSGTLIVGGRIGLWEEFLLQWLQLMREARPEISIRIESGLEPELMQGLIDGRTDIGVMYTPQSRPGLKIEPLFEEKLILVSTDPKGKPEPQPGYVYVDLGAGILRQAQRMLPGFRRPIAMREYRLARITTRIGERWLRLFSQADRAAPPKDQAVNPDRRRPRIFNARICRLSS